MEIKRFFVNIFFILPILSYGTSKEEPWNYTPAQYKENIKKGIYLTFSEDSYWFPELLRQDFLSTLEYILSEEDGIIRTRGVNMEDFNHCHILCSGKCTNELENITLNFERNFRMERSLAMGGGGKYDESFTRANLYGANLVIVKYEKIAANIINYLINSNKCNRPAILCHTFEENTPKEMRYGDPRRNIITFLGEKPNGYSPPDIDYASSYTQEFCHVLQIPFLIDSNGKIHITVGVDTNVNRFTGRIMN